MVVGTLSEQDVCWDDPTSRAKKNLPNPKKSPLFSTSISSGPMKVQPGFSDGLWLNQLIWTIFFVKFPKQLGLMNMNHLKPPPQDAGYDMNHFLTSPEGCIPKVVTQSWNSWVEGPSPDPSNHNKKKTKNPTRVTYTSSDPSVNCPPPSLLRPEPP